MPESIDLEIRRQDTPTSSPYWERYSIPYLPRQNVISVLMILAKDPRTRDGKNTSPVVYDRRPSSIPSTSPFASSPSGSSPS
jgi:succinate dehydrogenase / fumarate reductase iron-sulfur subunit